MNVVSRTVHIPKVLKLLQTFQNYYKSSCLIRVNEKNETFCRRNLFVYLSLFSFSATKIFGQIKKKLYICTYGILKEGTNIIYRLLLISILVISVLNISYRYFNIMHRNNKVISIHTFNRV